MRRRRSLYANGLPCSTLTGVRLPGNGAATKKPLPVLSRQTSPRPGDLELIVEGIGDVLRDARFRPR